MQKRKPFRDYVEMIDCCCWLTLIVLICIIIKLVMEVVKWLLNSDAYTVVKSLM